VRNPEPSPRRTAWHEAGHAVVAWALDLKVVLVSIRPEGNSGFGRSTHTPRGDCSIKVERQRECIVAMAGWAAELASAEATDEGTYDSGDLSYALSWIVEFAGEHRIDIELGWAETEAARIVSENLDRVRHLADRLLERGELADPDEIGAVIEGSA
jgi:hypothetical protein